MACFGVTPLRVRTLPAVAIFSSGTPPGQAISERQRCSDVGLANDAYVYCRRLT
jgi:hypothetical protein